MVASSSTRRLIAADVNADSQKLYPDEAFDPAGLRRFVDACRSLMLGVGAVEGRQR